MAEPHVISALVDKYSELSGMLQAAEKQAASIKVDMEHVEAVIKLYRSNYRTDDIKARRLYRRRHPNFKRGTYCRVAMDVLREAKEPLRIRDIARLMFEHEGVKNPDKEALKVVKFGLNACLAQKAKDGRITVHKEFYPKRFSISKEIAG